MDIKCKSTVTNTQITCTLTAFSTPMHFINLHNSHVRGVCHWLSLWTFVYDFTYNKRFFFLPRNLFSQNIFRMNKTHRKKVFKEISDCGVKMIYSDAKYFKIRKYNFPPRFTLFIIIIINLMN